MIGLARLAAAGAALALAGCAVAPIPTASPAYAVSTTATGAARTGSCQARDDGFLPDPACTPGETDPRVTQANIASTICRSGYTATVRPPVSVTDPIKRERMAAYGVVGSESAYEMDHRVPLEAGGAPADLRQFWPEGWERTGAAPKGHGAESKDRLENYVHNAICSGRMTLAQGQAIFLGDFWTWRDQHLGGGF